MIFGAVSAVFGVLQASVSTDLKQLLAYSTTENMGLITLALGAASLLTSSSAPTVAAIALTAALLHLLSHAAFKTLGFLAAGSVLAATGLRDLDKLGGLDPPDAGHHRDVRHRRARRLRLAAGRRLRQRMAPVAKPHPRPP